MSGYRRAWRAGGTWFFTVALAERGSRLLVARIDLLRRALRVERNRRPIRIEAAVVLPDHLHMIWTLPAGDSDFAVRWGCIKAGFSRALPPGERRSPSRRARGERGIWQRRYWEHLIRDRRDFAAHANYIHFNPVKHGLVRRVRDWPHSSFHAWVRQGLLPPDWGGDVTDAPPASHGEPP